MTANAEQVPTSNGLPMRCVMCRWTQFERKAWKLNTSGMEFMDLAWANKNATGLVCQRCRFIHWFHL